MTEMLPLSVAVAVPLCLLIVLVDEWKTRFYLSLFVWGSLSGFFAANVNTMAVNRFSLTLTELQIQFAPMAEELLKAAPLLALGVVAPRYLRRRELILAAIFAGFGFSVVENFLYMLRQSGMGTLELVGFVVTRSVSTSIMHGMATGSIGGALYFVASGAVDEFGFRPVYVFLGYSFAVILHALFNLVVQFAVLGQLAGVAGAILTYFLAWLFILFIYQDLDTGAEAGSVGGTVESGE